MQKLTAMTVGATALGVAAFAYDSSIGQSAAVAQTPTECTARSASVYFEKDASGLNAFSQAVIDRVAQDARACGVRQVVAQTSMGTKHADAIKRAFASKGLNVILAGSPQVSAQAGDFIADRSAIVRVTLNSDIG